MDLMDLLIGGLKTAFSLVSFSFKLKFREPKWNFSVKSKKKIFFIKRKTAPCIILQMNKTQKKVGRGYDTLQCAD